MTTPDQIQAAIDQFESAIITGPNTQYETLLGIPTKTILEALRVYAAVLGEPSDAVLLAGHRNAYTDNGILTLMAAYKAMTAEIVRQAKGE